MVVGDGNTRELSDTTIGTEPSAKILSWMQKASHRVDRSPLHSRPPNRKHPLGTIGNYQGAIAAYWGFYVKEAPIHPHGNTVGALTAASILSESKYGDDVAP